MWLSLSQQDVSFGRAATRSPRCTSARAHGRCGWFCWTWGSPSWRHRGRHKVMWLCGPRPASPAGAGGHLVTGGHLRRGHVTAPGKRAWPARGRARRPGRPRPEDAAGPASRLRFRVRGRRAEHFRGGRRIRLCGPRRGCWSRARGGRERRGDSGPRRRPMGREA